MPSSSSDHRNDLSVDRTSVFRLVDRRVRNRWTSEDITQEAILRLTAYYRSGKPIADVGSLVRRIALNLVRDHFRAAKRRVHEELPEALPSAEDSPMDALVYREQVDLALGALNGMPPLRREAFVRCRLHGESRGEVAAGLRISEAAVTKHIARAVLDLEDALARPDQKRRVQP